MATTGNRSPSPISTRPKPNSRTPEGNCTMRRIYIGNPFAKPLVLSNPRSFPPVTPANSPVADLGGGHSISKETGVSSRSYEEKENEKDQNFKPLKVRSPAIVKGTKNFMTHTISAAFKVTAAPKKKVLVEKNESVRTSILFSDGDSPFGYMNNSGFKEDVDSKEDSTIIQKDESFNSQVPPHSQNFSEPHSNMKSVESDMGFNQNKAEDSNNSAIRKLKKVSLVDSQVPMNLKSFSESISYVKPVESDPTSASNDRKIKSLGSSNSPIIAPLDADPSRPYDPKTNYLSPRPQFLRYKPNPRIEIYFHKEKSIGSSKQGKRLENSLISESFSDTDVTLEEIESENSNKESEDDSSVEIVNEEVEPHVYEPKPNSLQFTTQISMETVEETRVLKPRFFTRSKSVALILVLFVACSSILVKESPVLNLSTYKDLNIPKFYDLSEITEFSKASFDGFARNLKLWSTNSVFYLIKVISSLDEVNKLGPLQFNSNLTSLLEDPVIDGYLKVYHSEEINGEIHEQEGEDVEVEQLLEESLENGALGEEDDDSEEALEGLHIEEQEEEDLTLVTEVIEFNCSDLALNQEDSGISSLPSNGLEFEHEVIESHEIKSEMIDDGEVHSAKIDSITTEDTLFWDVPSSKTVDDCFNWSENKFPVHHKQTISTLALNQEESGIPSFPSNGPEFEHELIETHEIKSEIFDKGEVHSARIESITAEDTLFGDVPSSRTVDDSLNWSKNKFPVHHKQTISTLALALVVVTVIVVVYLKHRRITTSSAAFIDPLMMKLISTPPSQTWPADVDVVGEPCPSEMISFQKSLSYGKRVLRGEGEIQSQEKKQRRISKRRESLASSSDNSMGSPSYGSFTTCEKIPTKHGLGDEEIVTPVRRSSRFKNQVTSP